MRSVSSNSRLDRNGWRWMRGGMEKKVIAWLQTKKAATPAEFEAYLRDLYKTDNTLNWRFPNGF